MSQHTPGPWIARKEDDGRWSVCVAGAFGGKTSMAGLEVLWYIANGRPNDIDVSEANARLIAHAPAMREALERISILAARHTPPQSDDPAVIALFAAGEEARRFQETTGDPDRKIFAEELKAAPFQAVAMEAMNRLAETQKALAALVREHAWDDRGQAVEEARALLLRQIKAQP